MARADLVKAYFDDGMTQHECALHFGTSQKRIFTAMKFYGVKARVAAKREQRGPNNDSWKGDRAGKSAFHRRLYAIWGKPTKCKQCGTTDSNRSFDYANLSGDYANINDYAAMCRSCHWKYDEKIRNIKHMDTKMKGGSHA